MLVLDRSVVRLLEHLARLRQSVLGLYGIELDGELEEQVDRLAAGCAPGRPAGLRTVARPDERGGVALSTRPRPIARRRRPIWLDPIEADNGLGPHKWVDRRWLDGIARAGSTSLLLDAHGHVLEAAWGNVFALIGGVICTPPADGRILPGVTRAALLEQARAEGLAVAERDLGIDAIRAADAVVVTSALSGVAAAAIAGGTAPDAAHVRRLARLLA